MAKGYAEAAPATEQPPRLAGWLTKRVMITEREPLYHDGSGASIGQLVDREIEKFMAMTLDNHDPSNPQGMPVIHSVTVELPVE